MSSREGGRQQSLRYRLLSWAGGTRSGAQRRQHSARVASTTLARQPPAAQEQQPIPPRPSSPSRRSTTPQPPPAPPRRDDQMGAAPSSSKPASAILISDDDQGIGRSTPHPPPPSISPAGGRSDQMGAAPSKKRPAPLITSDDVDEGGGRGSTPPVPPQQGAAPAENVVSGERRPITSRKPSRQLLSRTSHTPPPSSGAPSPPLISKSTPSNNELQDDVDPSTTPAPTGTRGAPSPADGETDESSAKKVLPSTDHPAEPPSSTDDEDDEDDDHDPASSTTPQSSQQSSMPAKKGAPVPADSLQSRSSSGNGSPADVSLLLKLEPPHTSSSADQSVSLPPSPPTTTTAAAAAVLSEVQKKPTSSTASKSDVEEIRQSSSVKSSSARETEISSAADPIKRSAELETNVIKEITADIQIPADDEIIFKDHVAVNADKKLTPMVDQNLREQAALQKEEERVHTEETTNSKQTTTPAPTPQPTKFHSNIRPTDQLVVSDVEARGQDDDDRTLTPTGARKESPPLPIEGSQISRSSNKGKEGKNIAVSSAVARSSPSSSTDRQSGGGGLHKEIKEGIARLVQSLAVQHTTGQTSGISIITLAGDNMGASMCVGGGGYRSMSSTKREELVVGNLRVAGTLDDDADRRRPKRTTIDQCSGANVNSNVQAVNNSILHDSCCSEEDPGVHLAVLRTTTTENNGSTTSKPHKPPPRAAPVLDIQKLTHEPCTVKRRCLRALFLESSDDEPTKPRPRRHGCRFCCEKKNID